MAEGLILRVVALLRKLVQHGNNKTVLSAVMAENACFLLLLERRTHWSMPAASEARPLQPTEQCTRLLSFESMQGPGTELEDLWGF